MGKKAGFLTPKAIGNRIKAKGLGKLKFYCQMCAKQCRDANGFKCHITTDAHKRQMAIVAEDASGVIDKFSQDFEEGFLDLLSRRFGEKRKFANDVYQDYISERHHVHMTATIWETLTCFVKFLGRTGKCVVDETERGWFVQWIRRDSVSVARKEALEQLEKAKLNDEERTRNLIAKQIKNAQREALKRATGKNTLDSQKSTTLRRSDKTATVVVNIESRNKGNKLTENVEKNDIISKSTANAFSAAFSQKSSSSKKRKQHNLSSAKHKKSSVAGDIIAEEKAKKARLSQSGHQSTKHASSGSRVHDSTITNSSVSTSNIRSSNWVRKGIVVKILHKELGNGKFYKKKGVIEKVKDKFIAKVRLIDTGKAIRIDQDDLQTVLPSIGGKVYIVNGSFVGEVAKLQSIDVKHYNVKILLLSGHLKGSVITKEYEEVSKLYE